MVGTEDLPDLVDWTVCVMNNRMREETASFFKEGESVVAAVSGGADSMALLDCLLHCGKNLDVTAAHLNHCLRGEESDADAVFVEDYCKQRGIRCVVKRVDIKAIAKKKKISLELCGREERYAFFNEFGKRIATAHTLSDKVETMIFSLVRGAGLSGLCSIPQTRGEIVRPLLSFSRSDIEGYCAEYGISYRQDSSNFIPDVSRNIIRLQVLPILKKINSAVEKNVGRTISLLSQDEDLLNCLTNDFYNSVKTKDGLKSKELCKAHPALLNRALILFLKEHGFSPTSERIFRLNRIIKGESCRESLPNNSTAYLIKGVLKIEKDDDAPLSNLMLYKCSRSEYEHLINNTDNRFFFSLDCDKINGKVSLCLKEPGDSIKLANRPLKTLKKLYNEAAIPLSIRKRLRVLKDADGILWAEGFGVAQRAIPTEDTDKFLIIIKSGRNSEYGS